MGIVVAVRTALVTVARWAWARERAIVVAAVVAAGYAMVEAIRSGELDPHALLVLAVGAFVRQFVTPAPPGFRRPPATPEV